MKAACACTVLLLLPLSARCAQELELASALCQLGGHRLAIYLLERKLSHPDGAVRTEATGGLAKAWRLLADTPEANKAQCLEKAKEYCRKYLDAAPKSSRGHADIEGLMAELELDWAREMLRQAAAEKDFEKAGELRQQALGIFRKAVKKMHEAFKSAQPEFHKAKKAVDEQDAETIRRQRLEDKLQKAFVAMFTALQRYCKASFEIIEAFEEGSAERRQFITALLEELAAVRKDLEPSGEKVYVDQAWVEFAMGYAHFKAGGYDEAVTSFNAALDRDPLEYEARARPYVSNIQKICYYYKAKALFEARKYPEVVSTVSAMLAAFSEARAEDWGLSARELKCRGLWGTGKYEEATREARQALKDAQEATSKFVGNFEKLVREFHDWAIKNNRSDLLAQFAEPRILYALARGLYAEKRHADAITAYRGAVKACRRPEASWAERLEFEPKSWLEMGLCFYKLGRHYEAALAFEEVAATFHEKRLPKEITETKSKGLAGLLKEAQTIVERAVKNNIAVLAQLHKRTKHPFDKQRLDKAKEFKYVLLGGDENERAFQVGQFNMDQAEATLDPLESRQYLAKAVEEFKKVSPASNWYEHAVWKCGYACYRVVYQHHREWWKVKKTRSIPEDAQKEMLGYMKQMDRFFDDYFRYLEKHPSYDPKTVEGRENRNKSTPVLMVMAYYYCSEYDLVREKGAQALKVLDKQDANYCPFLWAYLKSLVAEARAAALEADLQRALPLVSEAARATGLLEGTDYFTAACTQMGALSKYVAQMLEMHAKGDVALIEQAKTLNRASVDWFRKTLPADATPDQKAAIAFQYKTLGAYEEAIALFEEVLNELDPQRKSVKDDIPANIFTELTDGARRIRLPEERTQDAVIRMLREAAPMVLDKEQVNYKAASERLDAALKTLAKYEAPQAAVIEKIRKEVEFRRLILACRTAVVECYVELARAAEAADKEKARRLFVKARDDTKALLDFWPGDRNLTRTLAEVYFSLGEFEEAAVKFGELERRYTLEEPEKLQMSRRLAESQAAAGLYAAARGVIEGLELTVPEKDLLASWPQVKEFKKEVIDKGQLAAVKIDVFTSPEDAYKAYTTHDRKLREMLALMDERGEIEGWDEAKLTAEKKQRTIDHFRNIVAEQFNGLEANLATGRINKEQHKLYQRQALVMFLAQPAVRDEKLRTETARLLASDGVTEQHLAAGIPQKYLAGANPKFDYLKLAQEMGIIDADGKILIADPEAEWDRLFQEIQAAGQKKDKEKR